MDIYGIVISMLLPFFGRIFQPNTIVIRKVGGRKFVHLLAPWRLQFAGRIPQKYLNIIYRPQTV